jgi:DNA mismatch repair protein MutL
VEVNELFYNVPARRKFLKSQAAEAAAVGEAVASLALANPAVHFRYLADGREVLNAPPAADPVDRILAVFGMAVADAMVEVRGAAGGASLSGHISRASLTRASAADQVFIVNGRPVRSKALAAAVRAAYKGRVMVGRHPVVVLRLDLPPEAVDVNVHPSKAEVRFRDEKGLASLVEEALARALEASAATAEAPLRAHAVDHAHAAPSQGRAHEAPPAQAPAYQAALSEVAHGLDSMAHTGSLARLAKAFDEARAASDRPTPPRMEPLGQIGRKYILARTPAGLAVVDQHAAAERVTYEALGDALARGKVDVQELIEPVVLDLHPRAVDMALERAGALRTVGFEVERFGARQLRVSTVPAVLADHADAALVHDILAEAVEGAGPSPDDELIDRIVASSACHYSLRAGEAVDLRRQARVIEDLYRCRNPFHCIHGRPTVIQTSIEDLDKMFKRTGAA